ncbi:MAG TPA: hypothetical protein VLZ83_01185 [Edaphocola sp.]|nr:hypothetical protein [Edaphocola sp.]
MKTTTTILRKAAAMLFALILMLTYSCDNNDDGSTNILDNTSWYLMGYEDSEGHFTPIDYPDDCEDNSCYTLRFTEESVFGTVDNYNVDFKDFWFGTYIAYSDNRFEYVERTYMELVGGRYSDEALEFVVNMYLVNRYLVEKNMLKLQTSENLILIFSKDRIL